MSSKFTKLTTGVVQRILSGANVEGPIYLQVLSSRRVANTTAGNSANRYRLLVSDGVHIHPFAMLAVELNHLFESNQLTDHTIIKVNRHVCSVVNRNDNNERRVVIFFELEVVHSGEEVGGKIGNPVNIDSKAVAAAGTAAQKENFNGNSVKEPPRNQFQKREDANASMSNASFGENCLTMPIDSLSPYQNKWTIKARITSKSNVRSWSNAKGEGKLFSFDMCDETGEIRATAFRDQVDKFYDMLEVDKVYYISKCQIKPANKQYSKLNNDYELTLTGETVIQECMDASLIPAIKYNFVPISDIANMEAGGIVDVIAICKEASDLVNLTSKAGRELTKREVTLIDKSSAAITLTLWAEDAKNFNGFEQPVLLVKNAKIGEFGGGKTLGTTGGSVLKMNPDIDEGHKLRGWYDNGGVQGDVKLLSSRTTGNSGTQWMTFNEAKLKNLGAGDKADYYQVQGFIHNVRSSNAYYKACASQDCNKKVIDQGNGSYRCDKCNVETPNFKYRLLVNMLIGDWTSNRWVTAFAETAEALFGKTSEEIGKLLENEPDQAEALFSEISFQQKTFKLRSKVETYQDVPKNKITLVEATDTNYKSYNKHLIANIQRLTGIHKSEA